MIHERDTDDGLTRIDDAPGYARGESGRVWKFGHPRKGPIWVGLKATAEITTERLPGSRVIRRTGRFYFPIFRRGLPPTRIYWELPECERPMPAPARPETADDDDCPF